MVNSEVIKKSPIDFVYIFAKDVYISTIAEAFSQSHAATIEEKRSNAKRAINGWASDQHISYEEAKGKISDMIKSQYGYSPEDVLVKLAKGEMVAGKDFTTGVFGVGDLTTFAQNNNISVNPTNGTMTFTGVDTSAKGLALANRTINAQGKTVEMNYTLGGQVYTSYYNPSTGKFVAGTYGDKNGMQFANGSTYDPSKAASVWQNINTALPIVQSCVEWLANLTADLFGKFKPITPENTCPAQTDFYTKTGDGVTVAGFGIVGALLIGGLILGKKGKKNN